MTTTNLIADGQDAGSIRIPAALTEHAGVRGLLLAVERLHKSLQQAIEELLIPHDLSVTQWLVISGMAADSGHTLTHFSRQLGRDAGSLSRAIHQLSQRGLLKPQRNPLDRRSSRLSLTCEGQRIHQSVAPQITRLLLALDGGQSGARLISVSPVLDDFAARVEYCMRQKSRE